MTMMLFSATSLVYGQTWTARGIGIWMARGKAMPYGDFILPLPMYVHKSNMRPNRVAPVAYNSSREER